MNPIEQNTIQYVGDIQGRGKGAKPHPFTVAAPDKLHPDARAQLDAHPGIEFVGNMKQAQAAIIRSATKFPSPKDLEGKFKADPNAHQFNDFPQTKHYVRMGDGHDNLDKAEACKEGVGTDNTPGVSSQDVALQTTAFALAWARRIPDGTASLKEHRWDKAKLKPRELSEMTLGIIGNGNIGPAVKRSLGMYFAKVQFFDTNTEKTDTDTLEELLATSDVVTIHIDGKIEVLTPELIKTMKRTQLLINTARGTNVNNPALLDRLNTDDGFMYASDVFRQEPVDFSNPEEGHEGDAVATAIIDHSNFFGTPHISASRIGNQCELSKAAVARVLAYAEHGHVNPDNTPKHTLPRIVLDPRDVPGIRGLVVHANEPGKLKAIYTELANANMNIRGELNGHSDINGLAMTQFDLEPDVEASRAVSVMEEIAAVTKALYTRLLAYEEVPHSQTD